MRVGWPTRAGRHDAGAGGQVEHLPVERIEVGERRRQYREESLPQLVDSIRQVGLIHPITVVATDTGHRLVTGRHRLEACRRLDWPTIPAVVLTMDALDAELAELDENLVRTELTVLERGEHLLRREEILRAKGQRAPAHRPPKGATVAPFQTTADLAEQMGISERSAQQSMQIARSLPDEVRETLRATPLADQTSELLELARIKDANDQAEVARLVVQGEASSVWSAKHKVEHRFRPCPKCGEAIDRFASGTRDVWHCDGCGNHLPLSERVCGRCGHKRELYLGEVLQKDAQGRIVLPDPDGSLRRLWLASHYKDARRQARKLFELDAEAVAKTILDDPIFLYRTAESRVREERGFIQKGRAWLDRFEATLNEGVRFEQVSENLRGQAQQILAEWEAATGQKVETATQAAAIVHARLRAINREGDAA